MSQLLFSDEELAILSKYTNSTSVAELLERFGGDIDKLKAYVKWLYKYGGTGSRGGGGPDTPSSSWSINATINNKSIKETTLVEKNETINVNISIGRPGSASYAVTVTFDGKKQGKTEILSAATSNNCTIPVRVSKKGTLTIKAVNNDGDYDGE